MLSEISNVGKDVVTTCLARPFPPLFTTPVFENWDTPTLALAHLVLDGLPVLWIGYNRQLELRHLLHLSVHVDLLQQTADLSSEQEQRVLLAMALNEQRRTGRVDRSNPVL